MDVDPWPAPAKINRFLHIVGRRPDGYHLLQTVFQFLDYCDYLTFAIRPDGQIKRSGELSGIDSDDDLTVRAARLLQKTCAIPMGVTIHIDKRLPLGGGLGGGSSDAATTLVALNHYWQAGLELSQLAELGVQLGADVPVFVTSQAAWAEGIGDCLTPITLDESWFVVLVPACQVATATIFNDSKLTRDSQPITIQGFLAGDAGNDCAAVVYRRYPEIAAAANWLSRYGKACLTGTGACVFAAFADFASTQDVLQRLPERVSGFAARGLNRSPLQARLQREITDA
ncbi:MAG: 4-(cytidine 5'-diphospho)-2-C-methyl-D-erythritol kinase [Candidatus Competibacteraceae bacterium]|jgi:4-diphosphocytidyl-2-C-methyl-D-erythritol kinase|nr:4-(cytidine 5'-diphospho)-2-C-methyl-D-erythritol kinase [Candidatus Competibacteraceae bacterium]